jgi:hypothetical protein
MRSRVEPRAAVEWLLRAALVALLALALWRSLRVPSGTAPARRAVTTAQLPAALHDASRGPAVGAIDFTLDSLPSPAHRAWLAALRGAGVGVRWRDADSARASIALAAERAREPAAPVRVAVASDRDVPLVLADSAGPLDTLRPRGGGAVLQAGDVVGGLHARAGRVVGSAALPTSAAPRAVLVLGRAGWEVKFIAAALSEDGWQVRVRAPAAPGVAVTDPGLLPVDTARYDVVVALDSTAADLAPAVARFVAQGGGLVAAGSATEVAALRALLPAAAGARRPGRILLDADTVTRADLPLRPLVSPRSDAVALERQGRELVVAARRAGEGRAISVGYDESWRWRMLGGAGGPAMHRAWWTNVVGLAAPEHSIRDTIAAHADPAPMVSLVEMLGPSSVIERAAEGGGRRWPALPLPLLVALAAALLAETASRRFRGAR